MAEAHKNIFWLTLSRGASLVMLFFAYALLFRYLGPHGTGQHQFILSYVTIFGVVIDFGILQYIVKKISEEKDKAKIYFHHFLAAEIFLAALVYVTMLLVARSQHLEPIVFYGIAVAGLGTAINGLTYPFLGVMSAFQNLRKVALINFVSSLINILFIFATIIFKQNILFLVGNQITFAIISLLMYAHFVKDHISKPDLLHITRFLDKKLFKNILISAIPFAMLVGFSTIYNRIDVLLISHLLGYSDTGLYTAAYKFFDLVSFFPAVVSHALYPVFTGLMMERNIVGARVLFEKYLRLMVAVAVPMGVGGSLLARDIIRIIAGGQFVESAHVLAILVWAPAALFIYIVANSIVISQLTRFAVVITGVNVVINTIGNLVLLPRIGITGAAIMTVVSECIQGIFYFYFVKTKIVNFHFASYVWQPILASLGMGAVLWFVRDINFILAVVAGVIAYGGLLIAFGFVKPDDVTFVKSIFMRKPSVV